MTSSLSEVDDLLTEEFPLLSPRPAAAAADLLPPGADEPSPGEGGPGEQHDDGDSLGEMSQCQLRHQW